MASRSMREGLVVLAGFAVALLALALYAGTWPPAVIVESSSMMHRDHEVRYGRLGTIDPGDLVLVRDVDGAEDVRTLVEAGPVRYGSPGDVIVYYRGGLRDSVPVIHRAVAYVDVRGSGEEAVYAVRWNPERGCEGGATKDPQDARWCLYDAQGVLIPSANVRASSQGMHPYVPNRDGFVTKGDNPVTNAMPDQVSGIAVDAEGEPSMVPVEWIAGEARGELPWIGLMKLALAPQPNEPNPPPEYVRVFNAYAPKDLWVMLAITLFVLVGVPLLVDAERALRRRREK